VEYHHRYLSQENFSAAGVTENKTEKSRVTRLIFMKERLIAI
jgi:hypothetical protein